MQAQPKLPKPRSPKGWGRNFTLAFYFDRRFFPWFGKGVTFFQLVVAATIFGLQFLGPLIALAITGFKPLLTLFLALLPFDIVMPFLAMRILDRVDLRDKTHAQWAADRLIALLSAKHWVNGKPCRILIRQFRVEQTISRERSKHREIRNKLV